MQEAPAGVSAWENITIAQVILLIELKKPKHFAQNMTDDLQINNLST